MHSISKFKVGDIVAFNKNTGAFNFNRIIYEYDYGRYDVEIILPDGRSDGRTKELDRRLSPLSFEQALLATRLGVL